MRDPAAGTGAGSRVRPRISVVVPTFNRRRLLSRSLETLRTQEAPAGLYEIVVVVDGSRDGTEAMLAGLAGGSDRIRFFTQPNRGLAAARNRGAAEARGEVVLFLDDDMLAAPDVVTRHDAAHEPGMERVVFGAVGLAEGTRRSFLKTGVERWGRELELRLSAPGHRFRFDDCHFGHASISRSLLERVGGFDEGFVEFGNEDYELGARLLERGAEMRFLPAAVARQIYDKSFLRWLSDAYWVGRADVRLAEVHPGLAKELRCARVERHPLRRLARRCGLRRFDPLGGVWGCAAVLLHGAERLSLRGGLLARAQTLLGERAYWRGIRDARGARGAAAPLKARAGRAA
jgi:glycosyltransferase involved in cell wall biosynthesis